MEDLKMLECLSSKIDDFILIGNIDAFRGENKQTEKILEILECYYSSEDLIKILKNYELGYEVGIIEKQACSSGMTATFDYKTGILEVSEENGFSIPYDEEYRVIEDRSLAKAKSLVKGL